ncbi:unnamed protein product [Colias eurytheme]|nr:unnamed protein product [Colias eurytheme]
MTRFALSCHNEYAEGKNNELRFTGPGSLGTLCAVIRSDKRSQSNCDDEQAFESSGLLVFIFSNNRVANNYIYVLTRGKEPFKGLNLLAVNDKRPAYGRHRPLRARADFARRRRVCDRAVELGSECGQAIRLYLREERDPGCSATLSVAGEAAWPGCGRLLLPGPLHLLLHPPPCAPSRPHPLPDPRARPADPTRHPLTNITGPSLRSVLTFPVDKVTITKR